MSGTQLPALIDRATRCLAEARTSAEVLEARAAAEAALAYAKVTKAANETQANCLRMIVRAEMRMADEIDRGQASGEVARASDGRPESVLISDTSAPITYEALGIDRRRVAEWRELRDAGSEAVEQAINDALSEGRAPTKADLRNHALRVMGSSVSDEWYTPPHIFELAVKMLGGSTSILAGTRIRRSVRPRHTPPRTMAWPGPGRDGRGSTRPMAVRSAPGSPASCRSTERGA